MAPVNDFRADAKWRSLRTQPPENDHALFSVPGINCWTLKLDLLHLCDLGTAAHLYGNVVNDLVTEHLPGRFAESLVTLNSIVSDLYSELDIPSARRISKLLKSHVFSQSSYPCLKHIKGRRIRHFADVAVKLCGLYNVSSKDKHREAACKAMKIIYDMADRPEFVWPKKEQKVFDAAIQKYLGHYQWLAKHAYLKGSISTVSCRRSMCWPIMVNKEIYGSEGLLVLRPRKLHEHGQDHIVFL